MLIQTIVVCELKRSVAVVCRDLRQSRALAHSILSWQLVSSCTFVLPSPSFENCLLQGAYNQPVPFTRSDSFIIVAVLHTPIMRSIFVGTSEEDSNLSHADNSAGVGLPHVATVSFPPPTIPFHAALRARETPNFWSLTQPTFRFGVLDEKGPRRTMEDAHSYVFDYDGVHGQGFFAVFDGHAGREAADWCGKNFHQVSSDSLQSTMFIMSSV